MPVAGAQKQQRLEHEWRTQEGSRDLFLFCCHAKDARFGGSSQSRPLQQRPCCQEHGVDVPSPKSLLLLAEVNRAHSMKRCGTLKNATAHYHCGSQTELEPCHFTASQGHLRSRTFPAGADLPWTSIRTGEGGSRVKVCANSSSGEPQRERTGGKA